MDLFDAVQDPVPDEVTLEDALSDVAKFEAMVSRLKGALIRARAALSQHWVSPATIATINAALEDPELKKLPTIHSLECVIIDLREREQVLRNEVEELLVQLRQAEERARAWEDQARRVKSRSLRFVHFATGVVGAGFTLLERGARLADWARGKKR
jgi:hypothetical protein